MSVLNSELLIYQERSNDFLDQSLPSVDAMRPLYHAMRYAVLSGGKRLRPCLVYLTGEALNIPLTHLDHAACALELIHAYSLVHDDLPLLDNDDLRRGKPSCHKVFGDALALLTGDALQSLAFEILTKAPFDADRNLGLIIILSKAIGFSGMVGGQALEFSHLSKSPDQAHIELLYRLKTGALFRAGLEMVAKIADGVPSSFQINLAKLGDVLGQCYQLQDDISDNEEVAELNLSHLKENLKFILLELIDSLSETSYFNKKNFLDGLFCLFPDCLVKEEIIF